MRASCMTPRARPSVPVGAVQGVLRSLGLPCPVISIGNLTNGGTGAALLAGRLPRPPLLLLAWESLLPLQPPLPLHCQQAALMVRGLPATALQARRRLWSFWRGTTRRCTACPPWCCRWVRAGLLARPAEPLHGSAC